MSNPSVLVPNIHQHVQNDPQNQRMTASVTSRGNSARWIFSSRVWSTGENVERIQLNPRIKARSLLRVRPALRAPRQTVRECVGSDACAVFARTHTLMNERGSWGRCRRGRRSLDLRWIMWDERASASERHAPLILCTYCALSILCSGLAQLK